jgi:hypothetical protein
MSKYGCNTCDATFDNPDSHDCKQEQLNKLQAQVEKLLLERQTVENDLADSNKTIRILEMEIELLRGYNGRLDRELKDSRDQKETIKSKSEGGEG